MTIAPAHDLRVLLCGGGSLGHLVPCLAVGDALLEKHPGVRLLFVCANRRQEQEFLRLRRRDFVAMTAPRIGGLPDCLLLIPRLIVSCIAAQRVLKRWKPDVLFTKGGSVGVVVCLLGWMKGIPIVLHESDAVMGRANRLIARLAKTVCLGFSRPLPSDRHIVTGNPVRTEILQGSKDAGKRITGFSGKRPVLMVIGGSQGSAALNEAVWKSLSSLLKTCDVIHLTGEGKGNPAASHARYWQRPMESEQLAHLYALADIVVSRAGAGVLSELAALSKAVIVVPLAGVAQDHQTENAWILSGADAAIVIAQERLHELPALVTSLAADTERRVLLGEHLHALMPADAALQIVRALLDVRKSRV